MKRYLHACNGRVFYLPLAPPLPQVLFCTLTQEQRALYRGYLSSKELQEIFAGSRTALAGIDILRKVRPGRPRWGAPAPGGARTLLAAAGVWV